MGLMQPPLRAATLRLECMPVGAWQARAQDLPADTLAILVGETLCCADTAPAWLADPVFVLDPSRLGTDAARGGPLAALLERKPQPVVVIQAAAAATPLAVALRSIRRSRVYVPPGIWLGLCRLAMQAPRQRQPTQIATLGSLLEGWIASLPRLQAAAPLPSVDRVRLRELAAWRAMIWSSVQTGASLGEVARASGMSLANAQRILRAGLCISPSRYRMELRLRTAATRMLAGSGRCDMLAADLAYASPSQFSADYRRLFGVSPTRTLTLLDDPAGRSDAA